MVINTDVAPCITGQELQNFHQAHPPYTAIILTYAPARALPSKGNCIEQLGNTLLLSRTGSEKNAMLFASFVGKGQSMGWCMQIFLILIFNQVIDKQNEIKMGSSTSPI